MADDARHVFAGSVDESVKGGCISTSQLSGDGDGDDVSAVNWSHEKSSVRVVRITNACNEFVEHYVPERSLRNNRVVRRYID